jgi:GNAT superfamily N-acetyltransferase
MADVAKTPAKRRKASTGRAPKTSAKLEVRLATPRDVPGIVALVDRAYERMPGYSRGMIRGQINNYPEGSSSRSTKGEIAGYCATMRLDERIALCPHTWEQITGDGFGSRHDPTGDWLYGYEMCVDPAVRGVRIGQRLYDARKTLAERLELKGIVFGARMPGFARAKRRVKTAEAYLAEVAEGRHKDPVLTFQLGNGFEPIGS